jgi:hypothetical protein
MWPPVWGKRANRSVIRTALSTDCGQGDLLVPHSRPVAACQAGPGSGSLDPSRSRELRLGVALHRSVSALAGPAEDEHGDKPGQVDGAEDGAGQ